MRIVIGLMATLAIAGCTRESSGFTFVDLTRGASEGLKTYQEWVVDDPEYDYFPERICLAGIVLEASLSSSNATSGSVGLPLAAPSGGLTGVLGYDLTLTEQGADKIEVPMEALYRDDDAPKKARKRKIDLEDGLKDFRSKIVKMRKDRDLLRSKKNTTKVRVPPPYKDRSDMFNARTDLAAELWRIREGIHDMVLNSPDDFTLAPRDLTFVREFRLIESGGPTINLKFAGSGTLSASQTNTTTETGRLKLVYVVNRLPNWFMCRSGSVDPVDLGKLTFQNSGLPSAK